MKFPPQTTRIGNPEATIDNQGVLCPGHVKTRRKQDHDGHNHTIHDSHTLHHTCSMLLTSTSSIMFGFFSSVWVDTTYILLRQVRYGGVRRSSASPRPPCDGTPSSSVWPSPRQTPDPSCPYPSDRPPSGHRPGRQWSRLFELSGSNYGTRKILIRVNFQSVKRTQMHAFQTCSVESFRTISRLYSCMKSYEILQ